MGEASGAASTKRTITFAGLTLGEADPGAARHHLAVARRIIDPTPLTDP